MVPRARSHDGRLVRTWDESNDGGAPRHSLWRKGALPQGTGNIAALSRVTSQRISSGVDGPIRNNSPLSAHGAQPTIESDRFPFQRSRGVPMRRRTFLTTLGTATGTGLCVGLAGGCSATHPKNASSNSGSPDAAVPSPPTPTATPAAFGAEPLWPPPGAIDEGKANEGNDCWVYCARNQYLTGSIVTDHLPGIGLVDIAPVVVDLGGPTTYVIHFGDSTDDFRTTAVTLEQTRGSMTPSADRTRSEATALAIGPSVLDDEYAYFVVCTAQQGGRVLSEAPLTLLKVQLVNGEIVGKATLTDKFNPGRLKSSRDDTAYTELNYFVENTGGRLHLSSDGTSLMFTIGANPYLALRLSKDDLTVQFDAHSIFEDTCENTLGAEAIYNATQVVTLIDGTSHKIPREYTPGFVTGRWLYMGKYNDNSSRATAMRNLDTGEDIQITDHPELSGPYSTAIISDEYCVTKQLDTIDVRRPGSTTSTLTVQHNNINSGITHKNTLFFTVGYPRKEVHLMNLDTGDTVKVLQLKKNQHEHVSAVTPYGMSNGYVFYPATEWMTGSKSPSPSKSS